MFYKILQPIIVEAQAVDDPHYLPRRRKRPNGRGIAGLRFGRHRSRFDKPKPLPKQRINGDGVFIEPGGETNGIGKACQPERIDLQRRATSGNGDGGQ